MKVSLVSRIWQLAVSVTVAALFPGPARAAENDIVIGMSAAFKGSARGLGIELYRGAQACFEDVNRAGGIHGRKIVIKAYDDGYEVVPAVENTIRLVEKDDVLLLFGYVGTATTTRVLPLLKRYQDRDILLFFPFTGAAALRRPPYDPFVYNLRASYQEETRGLVDHFVKVGRKRIGVLYQIDAYGRSGWEGVRAALKKPHGLSLAGEATYPRNLPFDHSMKEQVQILRDADADAVICVGAYSACAAFVRDARDAGWDVPIANLSFVGSESLLNLLIKAGEEKGTDYTRNLINSQVVPSYEGDSPPAVKEYREAMERVNPRPPPEYRDEAYQPQKLSFVSFEGYLDAKLLTLILRRAKPPLGRSELRAAAAADGGFDLGLDQKIVYPAGKAAGHLGLSQVYYTVVRKDRFVTLPEDGWKEWRQ